MQSTLNYAQAIEEHYKVNFVEAHIKDIVDDVMSSNFLATNSLVTYARYIRVRKISCKKEDVLLLLVSLSSDTPVAKMLGSTHLDDPVLYISSEEEVLSMIQAADSSSKSDHRMAPFHNRAFYRHSNALLNELNAPHVKQNGEMFPSFATFLDTKFRQTEIITHSILSLFVTTMRPFDYNERDKSKM